MDKILSTTDSRLELAENGFHTLQVYPAGEKGRCGCGNPRCRSQGKHPVSGGTHFKATAERREILDQFTGSGFNIAVHAGLSQVVILDIDPRNGGNETLGALEREYGELKAQVVVETGGGGQHLYFESLPGGPKLPSSLGPGVDVISGNKYAIAPPSLHASGGYYRWREGRGPEKRFLLTTLPSEIVEASQMLAAATHRERSIVVPETGEEIARLKSALEFISADCERNKWRDLIYAIYSTGWSCAEQVARDWSMTAPHRWCEAEFEKIWSGAR